MLLGVAVTAGMLWWRRARPAAYQRWSPAPRALQRLMVTSPAGWAVVRQALGGAPPYGRSALANYAVFGLTLFFASCGAAGTVLVGAPRVPWGLTMHG